MVSLQAELTAKIEKLKPLREIERIIIDQKTTRKG